MKILHFILSLLIAWQAGSCAKPSDNTSQTKDMRPQKKPDYVQHLSDGSNNLCSLTFINEYQAFTAAHCLLDPETGAFVPTRKVRLSFNEKPGKDLFVPIVSACYHPEFGDYYRQSFENDINKIYINPVSLAPFDFAIIQIGIKECNGEGSCGQLKGTSLDIAAQEGFGLNYKEQLKLPGNTPPATLLKFLDLEKQDLKDIRSGPLFPDKLGITSDETFAQYVEGAGITGLGSRNKDMFGEYRLGFAKSSDLEYSSKFGTTISANIDISEKPEARLGDSGSALHFFIKDYDDQFFADLNIPKPTVDNPILQWLRDTLKIYPIFAGVNSGLSEKYGIYSTPQSDFNQVLLQNLVYAGKSEPTPPWTDAKGNVYERTESIEKIAAIDITQYTLKGETYFCNIPSNSRITNRATGMAKIAAPPEEKQNPNLPTMMPLTELGTPSTIQYMKIFFDYVVRTVNDPKNQKMDVGILERGEAIDYVPLLVHQAKMRKKILEHEAAIKEIMNKIRMPRSDKPPLIAQIRELGQEIAAAKVELLEWTSNDAGISLNDQVDLTQATHRDIAKSLFKIDFGGRNCTGTIIDVSEQLGIETNHIYGMMPLHCLGYDFSSHDPATKIDEACASQAFQLVTSEDGENNPYPLDCRGPEDNVLLTRFSSIIKSDSNWKNSEKDIVLFPLKNEYKSRAIKALTTIPEDDRFAFYVIRPSDSIIQGADSTDLFEQPNLDFQKTFVSASLIPYIMVHDFKTESGHSGGIIVSRGADGEAHVTCMHTGVRTPDDEQAIENFAKRKPSGNRCLQMGILGEIFMPSSSRSAEVLFESIEEPKSVSAGESIAPVSSESLASAIAEVPVTPAAPSVPVNTPSVPMVAILSGDQPAVPFPANATSSTPLPSAGGDTAPSNTTTTPSSSSTSLSCNQCTVQSNCFCCDNQAKLSCNLRSDYPTASKSLDSIPKLGLIPHVTDANPSIYRVLQRVRTDSTYSLWLKINVNGQDAWVWSGE